MLVRASLSRRSKASPRTTAITMYLSFFRQRKCGCANLIGQISRCADNSIRAEKQKAVIPEATGLFKFEVRE